MTDNYIRELLRVSVAQICQTIGYHVIQATPFELLQDILHKFLHEIARDLHRQVEHYERTEANLDDISITLSNLNVNISELFDYANNVEPVPLSVEIPKFPAHKNTNLNFLKPGSKEVLIRPVHIYEYLPPILPADPKSSLPSHYLHSDAAFLRSGSINATVECPTVLERGCSNTLTGAHNMNRLAELKDTLELSPEGAKVTLSSSHMFDEEGRPTREISSVVMTTGGFISPAIEGKLPDTKVPKFVEKLMGLDAPPPVSPPAESSSENSRSAQYKAHTSNATLKIPVALYPKTLLSAENHEVTDGASSKQPLSSTSKDSVGIQNTTDITNLSVTNKFGLSPVTPHIPMQITTTKLLNKSKKKNLSTLHGALTTKPYLTSTESSGTAAPPSILESSEKGNRKNKKIMQKLLKPGIEASSHSSDYCNSVIQRHKMEKYLKKQSKLEKKLLHKQKYYEVKKKSPPLDLPSSPGDKLPTPLPTFSINNAKALSDLPLSKDSALPDVSKEKTCLLKPGLTDFSSLTFSQPCNSDNSFGIIDSGSAVDNTQLSPSEKKPLPGAKLSAEIDRNKLNIFKKISKQKSQKPSSPNSSNLSSPQMCGGNDGQFINLPCGTTITPSPPSLKSLIPTDTCLQSPEFLEKKTKMLVNSELGGALGLVGNSPSNNISRVPNDLSPQSLHFSDPTKPKKRGRKPGSKNLPKHTIASPNGEGDVTHLKKIKKLKASKYEQQQPLHLDTRNLVELSNPADNLMNALDRGEDAISPCVSTNIKDNRKERKKGKLKNLPLNMTTSEQSLFSAVAVIPTKEEVNTINKKLLRMDTILQPLGGFNEAVMDPKTDIVHTSTHNTLPYKSPTNRKRPSPSLQQQTTPNIMHSAHQPFMSKPLIGGIPELLKLCPFPPGPGLIPPSAQNLLFPRLPPTFQLPVPNIKPPPNATKSINTESSINNTSLDPPLLKDDFNVCDVPQFAPESMKHATSLAIPEMQNAEKEFLNIFNFHYLSTFCEKLIETPELWAPIENVPLSTTPACLSLNKDEIQTPNECFNNSLKTITENPLFGDASPTLNLDEILELFDESHELPPWLLNSSNSPNQTELDQSQNDLTATLMNFFQTEDIIPTFNETKQATESSTNGLSLESMPSQVVGERSYCNVPPFVPESMKLTSPDVISEMKKSERDCPKTPKIYHSTAVGEKILKTPEFWSTPETTSKSIPPTPGGMSLNTYELHLQNARTGKSPKSNTDKAEFVGGTYSQYTAPNTVLAKTSAATSILNTDDPIELSDDSIEYSTTALNITPKDLQQNQLQLSTSHKFSQMEDYVPIHKEISKNASGDLYLSSKDKKLLQKANKMVKNTTDFFPTPTENVPQIDLFNSEKRGVGKLAGGADLIPLISTGSAYSSKTIPSTSLTATVASPFALAKKDIYSTNAFENSLLPTNLSGNELLSVNNELQRKKKDHKKLKKLKEEKAKKKKDKKSKCKERADHHEKLLNKTEKVHKEIPKDPTLRGDEEQQQLVNKDLLKRLKKEKKKKYKQLFTEDSEHANMKSAIVTAGMRGMGKPSTLFAMFNATTNMPSAASLSSSTPTFVPKLTLKLGSSQSPTPVEDATHKNYFSTSTSSLNEFERKREPSPELARISPLVTRPAKQKFSIAETLSSSLNANTPSIGNATFDALNENNANAISAPKTPCVNSSVPPPSPWSSGGTISASSVLLPQQLLQPFKALEHLELSSKLDGGLLARSLINTSRSLDATARHSPVPLISETSRPSSYIDAEGNRVWICPACGKVDDGSPMIGCDGCDAWYHWICVGITIAPKDNEDWFCRVCITRKKGVHVTDKKRKRSKKK